MKVIYRTPTITSLGGRDGNVRGEDGILDLQLAPPTEMGGPGGKANPEQLFAAGYAACFHSALKRVAADRKIPIGKSIVEAHVGIGPNDDGVGFSLAVELHAVLPGANTEQAMEVVKAAHQICPYSNATKNNVEVMLAVTPADGLVHAVV